eukprot:GHVR01015136.1.p1 GENE.GHVR01015136.1~~GHVR01015136.1.p1  ORF type:complete len:138 (-),score=6.21 GHVR01015136.1:433-846(-)
MAEENIYLTSTTFMNNVGMTKIHRISVSRTSMTQFKNGKVPGNIINQFSLDEYKGKLRIATTSFLKSSSNNVFCLDSRLNIIGSLEDVAPGERIYSARYMEDKLYLVTFKQVDPFFVIDLSQDKPSILGHLKITGFS